MRRRLNPKIVIPAVAIGLLLVFAVVGALSLSTTETAPSLDRSSGEGETGAMPGKSIGSTAEARLGDSSVASNESAEVGLTAAVPPQGPSPAHHLVRRGDLALLIESGALLTTFDRVAAMTAEMGGYVLSSSLGSSGSSREVLEPRPLDDASAQLQEPGIAEPSEPNQAWLTLRVPHSRFEAAAKRFAELGDLQRLTTSSEDVTSQYVDLEAKLRHYRAVERRLLRFLAATDTVKEMLAVQDRIDTVQLTIEQLEAQLKSLRETTTYGTLSISLTEKGTPQSGASGTSDTFTGVFWNSLTLLGHGARVTALAVTAALPFLFVIGIVGLAAWYAARRVRGRRNPQQQSLTA
jgi:hypothetical protein